MITLKFFSILILASYVSFFVDNEMIPVAHAYSLDQFLFCKLTPLLAGHTSMQVSLFSFRLLVAFVSCILAQLGSLTVCKYWLDRKICLAYIYLTCQCLNILENCQEGGGTLPQIALIFSVACNEFVRNSFWVREQVLCVTSHMPVFYCEIFRRVSHSIVHNSRSG